MVEDLKVFGSMFNKKSSARGSRNNTSGVREATDNGDSVVENLKVFGSMFGKKAGPSKTRDDAGGTSTQGQPSQAMGKAEEEDEGEEQEEEGDDEAQQEGQEVEPEPELTAPREADAGPREHALEALKDDIDDALGCGDAARVSGLVARVRDEFAKELGDGVFGTAFTMLTRYGEQLEHVAAGA